MKLLQRKSAMKLLNSKIEAMDLKVASSLYIKHSYSEFNNTEEYIEDMVSNINEQYCLKVECTVSANGFQNQRIETFFENHRYFNRFLPHGFSIDFDVVDTNVPEPYSIWWKVRNVGEEAEKRNMIRGQIEKKYYKHKHEASQFYGAHYVECYVIKNNECVAIDHIDVPIAH